MKVSAFFKSNYLKTSDLNNEDLIVTIKSIEEKEFEEGVKPMILFAEIKQGLVLNRINARTIARLYGDEMTHWIDKRIQLFPQEVEFRGEWTPAIRIRSREPNGDRE